MQSVDDSLRRATLASVIGPRASELSPTTEGKEVDNAKHGVVNHLLNLGKVNLRRHPVRMRYLPYTKRRYLLYGQNGFEEMALGQGLEPYSLKHFSWQPQMCDCVETSDMHLYAVSRSHCAAVITCYNEFMSRKRFSDVAYPLGCLSSLATNLSCSHLYAANPELNCVLRFTVDDLSLSCADRFGDSAMWRPFDCCTSQAFDRSNGSATQYLFVSNLDAGIFVFDIGTMEIVAECGEDLQPGAKYLTYDPRRSLLIISSTMERMVRCYRFLVPAAPEPPWLHKIGDFMVACRKPLIRSSGSQCVMWDPDAEHLAVISWSLSKEQFMAKVFRVTVKDK